MVPLFSKKKTANHAIAHDPCSARPAGFSSQTAPEGFSRRQPGRAVLILFLPGSTAINLARVTRESLSERDLIGRRTGHKKPLVLEFPSAFAYQYQIVRLHSRRYFSYSACYDYLVPQAFQQVVSFLTEPDRSQRCCGILYRYLPRKEAEKEELLSKYHPRQPF